MVNMINKARQSIRETLSQSANPALLCSFGKESLVLLKLAREVKPDITTFWFGDRLSKFAESVIKENDLCIYSYAPVDRYLIPNADGYSLIDEYSFGSARVPLVSDLIMGDECELENLSPIRTPLFNWQWDVTLFGYRKEDYHPLVTATFPKRFSLGSTTMVSPLWDWSEADVYHALDVLRIPYEPESDGVMVCGECLEKISMSVGSDSLHGFQERFGWGGH